MYTKKVNRSVNLVQEATQYQMSKIKRPKPYSVNLYPILQNDGTGDRSKLTKDCMKSTSRYKR